MIVFIQLPDFGADFSHVGNIAKRVNGNANANAKPNIPIAGAAKSPVEATPTNKNPIIGPVQEKDTNVSVNAIKNILSNPLVAEALLSTELLHEDGRVISNHPKNDKAKTINKRQKNILKTALVANAFSELAPKIAVIASPRARYITIIDTP